MQKHPCLASLQRAAAQNEVMQNKSSKRFISFELIIMKEPKELCL
jgi:hypothetical protein